MAVLTQKEIFKLIDGGKLVFSPHLDAFQTQPHSVDLRLGHTFYIPKTWKLTKNGREAINVDPLNPAADNNNFTQITLSRGQYFEILPKEFIITTTLEKMTINTDNIMAVLYPRSSINRRGLAVDLTGIIDVWYNGPLMIPMINNTETQTIRMYPGERICQITFEELSSGINKKDGLRHGLERAKYMGTTAKNIGYQLDKKTEAKWIKKGKIAELKKKFAARKNI